MTRTWDAIVVGGGPAGLSAAFWLARYRRSTLVLDDQRPRNEAAWAVHGYPGLVDPNPEELRARLREQATGAGAVLERCRVERIVGERDRFVVDHTGGEAAAARRVLLAYGRTDRIPEIPGLDELYGSSVFHCPDCDGPSVVDLRIGVLGHDRPAAALALYLLTWAADVTLLTGGRELDLEPEARATLEENDVAVVTDTVHRLEGASGCLEQVHLGGRSIPLDVLFFHWGSSPAASLGPRTGCECTPTGDLVVDPSSLQTSVRGVYAAGDIIGRPYLAVSAAAEGVRAALAIHRSLLPPEFDL